MILQAVLLTKVKQSVDTDSEDWKELLDLLKRCRTKQPINGLLMMISVEDILTNNEAQL